MEVIVGWCSRIPWFRSQRELNKDDSLRVVVLMLLRIRNCQGTL